MLLWFFADLIQKLISKGKQLLAIKFVFEFMLTEKFPPVPLLKAYLKDVKNLAKKVRKDGNESRMALVIFCFLNLQDTFCNSKSKVAVAILS